MTDTRLATAALAGVALAVLMPERFVRDGPPLCPVRRITGRPCPACGITRSWNAAARLKLGDSVRFHPFGMPALAATLLVGWRARSGRQVHIRPEVVGAAGVAWLGVWLVRLRRAAAG